jgi:hypothetical protein
MVGPKSSFFALSRAPPVTPVADPAFDWPKKGLVLQQSFPAVREGACDIFADLHPRRRDDA